MAKHPHGSNKVVYAVEVPFFKGAEVPHACINLLDGFGDVSFIRMLRFGGIQSGTTKAGQVFIVGA